MTAADAVTLLERLLPIVVFLLAITVTAEVAERAGVFDVAGHWVAHAGRHRAWALWLLFALLAVGCTVVLSIDPTAAAAVCDALGPLFAIGAAPWAVSLVAAALLLAAARWGAPELLPGLPVPWLMAGASSCPGGGWCRPERSALCSPWQQGRWPVAAT